MKNQKRILLLFLLITSRISLLAWTSSNEGVCYTMDTLILLSDSINYNQVDQRYEVDCDIIILENDTLKVNPGSNIMFNSYYPPGNTIQFGIIIYGCLIAIGESENNIIFGDPDVTFSSGNWWNGIQFFNTSKNGESIIKHCQIRGATHLDWELETALLCENSSPLIDHCKFSVIASGEETGGASAIGLKGQSYPIVSYCNFEAILNGLAIWCNPYNIQDTVNYPSPLLIGCNISKSVQGCNWPLLDYDIVVFNGGFLDNCYLPVPFSNFPDTTLGFPIDTIGDGICNTTSTYELQQKFLKVDGVVNPRGDTLITGIDETEINILPTTTKYLKLNENYPNPFSKSTTIDFEVRKRGTIISLFVYDSKGNLVKKLIENHRYPKGSHSINWYADNDNEGKVKPGIYFYKLKSDGEILVKKAIVVKS